MPKPIHVCIVTTAHPIDDVRVNNKVAHAFRGAGFRVSWVGPGHAFFDQANYNRDGINFFLTSPNRNRFDRLRSFARVRRLAKTIKDVDVYYAPDPDSAPLAVRLAKRCNAKAIFDIHEIYHGALLDRWLMGRRLGLVREFVRRRISQVCMRFDLVMGVNDAVLDPYFTDRSKRMVVRSCAPSWFADGPPADVYGAGRSAFRAMHGKGALQRGSLMVLEGAALAFREVPSLKVVMFATGKPEEDPAAQALMAMARERGIADAVDLRKGVPMQDMPEILRSCDAGMIAYGRELGVDSLPNRLFEYMAVGLPVIAPSYALEMAKIIKVEQCGLLVDFEDPASIAAAIAQLHGNPEKSRDMGRRGREAFLARHNWEVEVRPLLDRIRSWFPEKGRD